MSIRIRILLWVYLLGKAECFAPPMRRGQASNRVVAPTLNLSLRVPTSSSRRYPPMKHRMSITDDSSPESEPSLPTGEPWNPLLRRIMGSVATLGVAETAYLTYSKLSGSTGGDICGTDGNCASVLQGPYSVVPFTDVPLAAAGCAAYTLVALLALTPLLLDDADDDNNRILLLSLTTAMGVFSAFLVSLLVGILHTGCPYCFASAALSFTLAGCAWLGGCLPSSEKSKLAVQSSLASFAASTALALTLFLSVDADSYSSSMASSSTSDSSLLASTTSTPQPTPKGPFSPPPITTTSSERALGLSRDLQSLNARMFGAYWCSHCYDQKMTLGKQAMQAVNYVECSKDGVNSQTALCKERDVPGYPTWEIGGELFPGEQELDELEDIVAKFKK